MVSPERIYDVKQGSGNHAVPRLTVPWQPRHKVFLENLQDLVFPRPKPRLLSSSAPGIFWKDVFVHRPVAVRFIIDSYALHVLAVLVIYFIFSSPFFMNQRLPPRDPFARATIEYYTVSEYLPPLRSMPAGAKHVVQGQPVHARQEIMSVPPEPDNSRQTIVTPDLKVISRDVRLPNIIAWADHPDPIQPLSATDNLNPHPKLFTPPDIIAPPPEDVPQSRRKMLLEQGAIMPAPDVKESRHNLPQLMAEVVKPAPEVGSERSRPMPRLELSIIEPPPSVHDLRRVPGTVNIGKLAPTVAEPKMPVSEQRTVAPVSANGGGSVATGVAKSSAYSAPPAQAVGPARGSGRLIALSAQPAPVLGPIEIPLGTRRGIFAAGPGGELGAPGTPAITASESEKAGPLATNTAANASSLPEGLYVGPGLRAPANGGTVVAAPSPAPPKPEPSLRDRLLAAMHGATVETTRPPMPTTPPNPAAEAKIENKIFGDKKFYSMVLNMPNLNSSTGSWIIRFAELNPTKDQADLSAPVALNKVDPAYPPESIRDKVEGTVVLYAVIRASGTVDSVRVIKSVDEKLDKSATSALQHWRFRPGTKHGTPVDIEAVVQIPFHITRLSY
jgi:TonB family protein